MPQEQVLEREHTNEHSRESQQSTRKNASGNTQQNRQHNRKPITLPRPLVQANRAFLVVTISLALLIGKALLVIPFLAGVIGLAFRWNPVMAVGRQFLRKEPSEYRREDPSDQRFNQWIATVLLGLSGLAFLTGFSTLGYLFSGMVILAAGVALAGFCVGCYIHYQIKQWQHRRA